MVLYPLAVITLGIMGSLAVYLRRVPEAGACRRCGGDTLATGAGGLLDRWAPLRACGDCGWQGRMRGHAAEEIEREPAPRRMVA